MGSDELLTFADAQVFFFNFSGEVFKKYRHLLRKRGGGKGVLDRYRHLLTGGRGEWRKGGIDKAPSLKASPQELGDD